MKTVPQLVELPSCTFLIYNTAFDAKMAIIIIDGTMACFRIFKSETIHEVGDDYAKVGREVVRLKDCTARLLPRAVWAIDPTSEW